jgi:hypothetical protein
LIRRIGTNAENGAQSSLTIVDRFYLGSHFVAEVYDPSRLHLMERGLHRLLFRGGDGPINRVAQRHELERTAAALWTKKIQVMGDAQKWRRHVYR